MKKLIFILVAAATLITTGCEDWLAVNDSPNNPTEVPADLVLPSAESALATRLGGNMFNYSGFFAQYWSQAPEANQYNAIDEYEIKNEFLNNDYAILYSDALVDLEYVRDEAEAAEDWGNYLAATVLRAYTYQVLVDIMGKAPFSEAFKGSEIPMPKWDDGKAIYQGLIEELNFALDQVSSNSAVYTTDLIFNQEATAAAQMKQWIGFANALKLKLYMRSSYENSDNLQAIKDLVAANNFFSGDVTFGDFSDESGKRNPWYETNEIGLGTVNNIATYPIITFLRSKNDPRMDVLYSEAPNADDYAGNMPGWKSRPGALTDDYSAPVIHATQPVYLFTQTELQLFIAEAELRFNNNDAAAEAAYQAAIDANLELHELSEAGSDLYGSGRPYEWNSGATTEEKLEQIMLQKWVSLCMVNHVEAWTEIRRTGYPSVSSSEGEDIADNPGIYTPGELIVPVVNSLGDNMIQRVPFPEDASTLNENTPEQVGNATKIWWDKK